MFRLQGWKWPSVQGCEREQLPSCLSGDCSLDESGIRSKMLYDSTGGWHLGWLGWNRKLFIIILSKHFISLFRSYVVKNALIRSFQNCLNNLPVKVFRVTITCNSLKIRFRMLYCIFICTWFLSHQIIMFSSFNYLSCK